METARLINGTKARVHVTVIETSKNSINLLEGNGIASAMLP